MSISDQITALTTDKTNIANAITAKGGTVQSGDGFDNFATDIATIPGAKEEQSKTLTLTSTAPQTVYPDTNKVLSSVPVTIDSTVIKAENIAQGVTILGIEGTHSGGITPSGNIDLTATTSTQTGIDVYQYATASVAPTPSESKTLTLGSSAPSTVTPSSGKYLSSVPVTIDTNVIKASNIAQGVTMLGIAGTHSGGVTPTGTITINADGTYDVTQYATASVTAKQYNAGWRNILPAVDSTGKLLPPSVYFSDQLLFTGVKDIGTNALSYKFFANQSVTYANFIDLEQISGVYALRNAFEDARILAASFPKLTAITGSSACINAFSGTHLRTLSFPKLKTLTTNCMQSFAYNCHDSLETVYFYKLDNSSFENVTGALSGFLGINSGVTVHCQPGLNALSKDAIRTMGGSGTIFLYDLGGTVNFNVTPSTAQEYMYNEEVVNHSCLAQADVTSLYEIYDNTNNVLLIDSVSNVVLYETQTVTKDLTTDYHQIKLDLSSGGQTVGGLNATITVLQDGAKFPMAIDQYGGNSINQISPVNTPLTYYVDGGDNYSDAVGTILTANEDITESITLSPAQWNTFVRPNLTENGTLGGDSFAVWTPTEFSSYYAYYAVDSSTTTFWSSTTTSTTESNQYKFYNPNPLKITTLVFTFSSVTYRMTKMTIWGSNDDVAYTDLTGELTNSAASFTATVNNTTGYKYFKITYSKNTYVRLKNLAINGTYKSLI